MTESDLAQIRGKKIGFIFNLDRSGESGSHWVSLFSDLEKNRIYFFDSVGDHPMREVVTLMDRIEEFCKKNNNIPIDRQYNKKKHQHGNSECGVYSVSFILRLLDGETFDEISNCVFAPKYVL